MSIPYRSLRLAAALVLASALWMPAYTCAGYRSPAGKLVDAIPTGADSAAYTPAQIPHRPVDGVDALNLDSGVTVLVYTWALLILGLRLGLAKRRGARMLRWTEPVLAGLAGWAVWEIGTTGDIAYGTWVALSAVAVLGTLAVMELVRHRGPPDGAKTDGGGP